MDLEQQAYALLSTVIWFAVALALFGLGVYVIEKVTPFSIRKEIEEDHNTALAILMGSALIGLALILSSVIRS